METSEESPSSELNGSGIEASANCVESMVAIDLTTEDGEASAYLTLDEALEYQRELADAIAELKAQR